MLFYALAHSRTLSSVVIRPSVCLSHALRLKMVNFSAVFTIEH